MGTEMQPLKILVIEDEFLIALDLEQILTDAGHEVCGIAARSYEALRLAGIKEPQLAFVDIDLLDGRTGFEIGRSFARAGAPLAIFVTSHESELSTALEVGAGMLSKPYRPRDIVSAAAYFAQGLLTPPPKIAPPRALRLAPGVQHRFAAQGPA